MLAALGACVVAALPRKAQRPLVPVIPLIGAGFLVLVLHLTTLVVGVRVGAWVAVALALGLLGVAVLRRTPVLALWRPMLPVAGVLAALGAAGALLGWLPSLLAGNHRVIQPDPSHDAFWYVSTSRWLLDHTIFAMPSLGSSPSAGTDAVLFGPAVEAARNSTRLGQELVLGALSTVTGIDLVDGFSAWIGLWVVLTASAAWFLASSLTLRSSARWIVTAVVATLSVLTSQVLAQNADSLLGTAFVLLTIGLVIRALGSVRVITTRVWLAAAALGVTLGTYTEYLPFLGLVLAFVVLLRAPGHWIRVLRTAVLVVLLSLLVAPVLWLRAVRATLFVGTVAGNGGGTTSPGAAALILAGPFDVFLMPAWRWGLVLVAIGLLLIAVGGLAALVDRRTRGMAVGVVLGMMLVGFFVLRVAPYLAGRAVDMITPLVIVTAAVGLAYLARRRGTAVRRLALGAAAGAVAVNLFVSIYLVVRFDASDRVVTPEFAQARQWVDERGGESGEDVTAAVGAFWDQLWLSYALSDDPDVAWPSLRGDLGYRADSSLLSFWEGELDPWVLVGPGAYRAGAAPVEESGGFALMSTDQELAVAVPVQGTAGGWETEQAGDRTMRGDSGARVAVLSSGVSEVVLRFGGLAPNTVVTVRDDGGAFLTSAISDGSILELRVPAAGGSELLTVTTLGDDRFSLAGVALR